MKFNLFNKEISDAKDGVIKSQNQYIDALKNHNQTLQDLVDVYKRLYLINEDIIQQMKRKQLLTDVMEADQKDGLYDENQQL